MDTHQTAINPFARQLTKAVRVILIVTACVFIVQLIMALRTQGDGLQSIFTAIFSLNGRELIRGSVWQPITYMFLHGGIGHIFFNMLMLYFFGCEMEGILGTRRFVGLYIGCGVLAGIGWVCVNWLTGSHGYCIGASGAVLGILGAFAAMFPDRKITLLVFFVLPVTVSARWLAAGIGLISVASLMVGGGNIAHSAHLAGGLAGYLYGLILVGNPGSLDSARNSGKETASSWLSDLRAAHRRKGMHVVSEVEEPTAEEIDLILEKISAKGMGSLTKKEREILNRAGKKD